MEKILEQIDGIIGDAFYLPKSDATDKLLADLEDLRNMVASQQPLAPDVCLVCENYQSCPGENLAPEEWSCALRTRR
jgi:hypothetical protein